MVPKHVIPYWARFGKLKNVFSKTHSGHFFDQIEKHTVYLCLLVRHIYIDYVICPKFTHPGHPPPIRPPTPHNTCTICTEFVQGVYQGRGAVQGGSAPLPKKIIYLMGSKITQFHFPLWAPNYWKNKRLSTKNKNKEKRNAFENERKKETKQNKQTNKTIKKNPWWSPFSSSKRYAYPFYLIKKVMIHPIFKPPLR